GHRERLDHPRAAARRSEKRIPSRRASDGFDQGRPPTLDRSIRSSAGRETERSLLVPHFIVGPTSAPARDIEAGPPYAGAGVTSSQIFVSFVSGNQIIPMTNVMMGTRIGQRRARYRLPLVAPYTAKKMSGVKPPNSPFPRRKGRERQVYRIRAGKNSTKNAAMGP